MTFGRLGGLRDAGGRLVPVRFVAEQHVIEDLGHIPTAADWLRHMSGQRWMTMRARKLSEEFPAPEQEAISA